MSVVSSLSQVHQTLFEAKKARGFTFAQIGEKIGRDEVYVAAVFYGQAKPTKEDIAALSKALGLTNGALHKELGDQFFPERGQLTPMPPTDPLLYRLYEIILTYGYPLKSVMHEKFGDGIMSAINFNATVDKVEKDGQEFVKLTFLGKWLPYARW
ncbi:hypothetical protein JCM10213_001062 [Rhodosporidiobolus nylandii]